jgi:hypothetical protein
LALQFSAEKSFFPHPARILRRLNSLRNTVEHEYYSPTRGESEDFVDVVALFLAATQSLMKFTAYLNLYAPSDDDYVVGFGLARVEISFDSEHKKLELIFSERDIGSKKEFDCLTVKEKDHLREEMDGTEKKYRTESKLDEAARYAVRKRFPLRESTQTISASEGQVFCEWISLVISKNRDA